ncbi:MAG: hypothetical protein CMF39_01135 [Legionellaceae bacterium]|nr:hypothetical protein [Legionellaceae bacterium]|tara:strand:+ start:679 stop:1605 length:927 start_codon:yes stop_codon:yes gene_type:complete
MTEEKLLDKAICSLENYPGYAKLIEKYYLALSNALDKSFLSDLINGSGEQKKQHLAELYIAFILHHHLGLSIDNVKPKTRGRGPDFFLSGCKTHIEVTCPSVNLNDPRFQTTEIINARSKLTTRNAQQKEHSLSVLTGVLSEENGNKLKQLSKIEADESAFVAISYQGLLEFPLEFVDNEPFPSYVRAFLPINNFPTFNIKSMREEHVFNDKIKKQKVDGNCVEIEKVNLWKKADEKNILGVILFNHNFDNNMQWLEKNARFDVIINPFANLNAAQIKKFLRPINGVNLHCVIYHWKIDSEDIKIARL